MIQRVIRLLLRFVPRPLLIRFSLVVNRVVAFFLKGDNVECPICGGRYRRFLPYGYTPATSRKNALCPGCLSLERHRLLWLFLKENTKFFQDSKRVLHIAPEQCFYKRFRALPNMDYTTADLESPIADVHFDVQHIPYDDNSFDVVICNHVMEHVEDDGKALSEIYRVLKHNGMAIVQVPQDLNMETTYEDPSITDPREREKHFLQKDHVRLYGRDYAQRLGTAGFKVSEEYFVKTMDSSMVKRLGLPENEIIYLNLK